MAKAIKTMEKVLSGTADSNIAFGDLCQLMERLNFDLRIRGDHHIYSRSDVEEILNLQPRGKQAKPYQVKQVRNVILRYQLEVQ